MFAGYRKVKEECEKEKTERLRVEEENQLLKRRLRALGEGPGSNKRRRVSSMDRSKKRSKSDGDKENIHPPDLETLPPSLIIGDSSEEPETLQVRIGAEAFHVDGAESIPWHEDQTILDSIADGGILSPLAVESSGMMELSILPTGELHPRADSSPSEK